MTDAEDAAGAASGGAALEDDGSRQETILARYSRNFKLAVVLVVVILLCLPVFLKPHHKQETPVSLPTSVPVTSSETPVLTASAPVLDSKPADALNDQDDHSIKLTQAPIVGLTEDTPDGTLPRISENGLQPWQAYARPFNTADQRPRIAIVIVDLGLSRVATDAAINRLPTNVTLAFDPQSPVVGAWMNRARQNGHETMLMLPMEPFDYPRSDPGPNTMLTSLPNSDNLARLDWALRQGTGYVGVTTLSGSRFTTDPDKLASILDVVRRRGLLILDARVAPHSAIMDMAKNVHVPSVAATERLDQVPSPEAIDQALDQLVKTARLTGRAVGIASPLPTVLDRLQNWFKTLPQDGVALAPLSAMVP